MRSTEEVEGYLRQARTELAEWGPSSEYVKVTRAAAIDAFEWLLGRRAIAPASGTETPADADGIRLELMRAVDLEQRALEERRDGRRPGRVGVVLSWAIGDEETEPPL